MDTKDNIMTTVKFISLQRFCEIIPDHVQSGTEFYRCLLLCDTISDEIVSGIHLESPLDT